MGMFTILRCWQALPRMAALFSDWAPLSDPSKGVQQVQAWRPLLESQAARDSIFQVTLDPLSFCQALGCVSAYTIALGPSTPPPPRHEVVLQ